MADLRRAGLHAAVIGEVTDSGALEVRASGELVADLPIELLTDVPPHPARAVARPGLARRACSALDASIVPPPDDLAAAFLRLLADPGHRQPGAGLLDATTTWSAPTPSSRPAATPRCCASRARARASRSRPTATAASASSTRARAARSRSPRRPATSPAPARCRSRSPTASTSARRTTRPWPGSWARSSTACPRPAGPSGRRSSAGT